MARWPRNIQPLPAWDTEQVFFSAADWFSDLLKNIQQAQRSIFLQTYIFSLDSIGEPLLQSLCEAAQRGVRVCVIVDGVGSSAAVVILQERLRARGAELHIYHPLPWSWAKNRIERSSWAARFFRRLWRVNQRQHSKLCLIDNQQAWVGSFNITDDHIENHDRSLNWKDCGVRVTGSRCQLLREFFEAVWLDDIKKLSPYFLLHPVTNLGLFLRRRRLRVMLQSLYAAKQRIWIVSAYFSPVQSIIRALKKAGRRKVDVCIMVPAHSDVKFFPALSSTYYLDLLRAGVRIYEYEKGILHTKMMLVDDAIVIGSSNMNHRSMLHDIELDIPLYSTQSRNDIEKDCLFLVENSREITIKNINKFYAWLLVFGQIPRLLRYWL
ncbi:MAG: phosphatidylserine/phosphatidylglycerophosphate/cardiolipin synthase family protein [Pseudomonadales bacterium]